MLASALIIGFSLILLVYWFRYSCLLLLRTQSIPKGSERSMAADNRFSIGEVQALLKSGGELDALQRSLQRDYQVLTYLLSHAAALDLGSFEDRILVLDYRVMQAWYRLTKTAAPRQAREALTEMADILDVLVQKMGQQAGIQAES